MARPADEFKLLNAAEPKPMDGITVLAAVRGGKARLPAGYPLGRARFACKGSHLEIRAAGFPDAVVPNFFADGAHAALVDGEGAEISHALVMMMATLSPRLRRALERVSGHN